MSIKVIVDQFGFNGGDETCKSARCFTLNNGKMSVQLVNYGAAISSLKVPDSKGKMNDIVLGYDNVTSYVNDCYYFGSTIGRFANRIYKGKFFSQDKQYFLSINNGPNHLHGGFKGFNKVMWNWKLDGNKVVFYYTSPSMEENYPGELNCFVTYELTDRNEVLIQYYATSTERTPVNLTNHSYFNLGGHDCGTVHDHLISIYADHYTPLDENSIPTGEILPVTGTPFDLRNPQSVSSVLNRIPDGVDHNFCISGNENIEKKVARVEHPQSGRVMEIFSTQPGVQFYTANFLPEDDSLSGKDGACYKKHGAMCFETQNYPDAVNHLNFPNAFLDAGDEYKHTTKLCFSKN